MFMTPEDKKKNYFFWSMFFPYWSTIWLKEIIKIVDH